MTIIGIGLRLILKETRIIIYEWIVGKSQCVKYIRKTLQGKQHHIKLNGKMESN